MQRFLYFYCLFTKLTAVKKSIIFFLFAIYFLASSSSCKKTSVADINNDFPNKTGTWWKYKVFDSVNLTLDIITINILGNSTLEDGTGVKIWQIHSLNSIRPTDTNYIYTGSDGVKFYFTKSLSSFYKSYKFPLVIGSYWIGTQSRDTSKVISQSNLSVLAGTFNSSYLIERSVRYIPNGSLHEKDYFYPNVGLITRTQTQIGGGYSNFYWELVTYSIK